MRPKSLLTNYSDPTITSKPEVYSTAEGPTPRNPGPCGKDPLAVAAAFASILQMVIG